MVGEWTDTQATGARSRLICAIVVAAGTIAAALLLPWPWVLLPTCMAVAALALFDRRQVRALFNRWLWLGLILAVLAPLCLARTTPATVGPHLGGSRLAALAAGLTMALRLVATLAGLLTIGSCLSPLAVIRGLSRMLGRDLALACAIGVNLLPAMVEMLRRTTLAMRLRGGFRRRRLANIKRLVVAVGLQTVRLTEDVAEALLLSGVLDGHETVTRRTVEPAPDSSRRPE